MEARRITLIVLVAALLLPFTSVLFSDDSDAAGEDYAHYYRDQLSSNQLVIYNALTGLDPASVTQTTLYGEEVCAVHVTVGTDYVLSASSASDLAAYVLDDMVAAWQATMLDLPLAWWTWSTDNAGIALFSNSFSLTGTSVTGFEFDIRIADCYMEDGKNMSTRLSEVEAAFDELVASEEIEGDDSLELIQSFNDYLCSSSFEYDKTSKYQGSVYGALVASDDDGVHHITCMGYSKLFKMLCDKYGIDCVCVIGSAVQDSGLPGGHMWNVVRVVIDDTLEVLGVDTTFNDTGDDKESFLLCGYEDEISGYTFTMSHQPFTESYGLPALWESYYFASPELSNEGYDFPEDANLLDALIVYLPWVITGIICAILALVLLSIVRRGD